MTKAISFGSIEVGFFVAKRKCGAVSSQKLNRGSTCSLRKTIKLLSIPLLYNYIVYVRESAAYGIVFTSCEKPNERGTSE